MIFPHSAQKGDYRITCDHPDCEEQEIIEGFPNAETALVEAKKSGWSEMGNGQCQCPHHTDEDVLNTIHQAKGNLT